MTTFANYSNLLKESTGKKVYVELSNGWFLPVSKKDLRHLNDRMTQKADDVKFCGEVVESSDWFIKIKMA